METTQETSGDLFNVALGRLTSEVIRLRSHLAILDTLKKRDTIVRRSKFLAGIVDTIRSDVLIRLVRVFEQDSRVASFWFLYSCDRKKLSEGTDISVLRTFSRRVKSIRDKTFVHIDRNVVFNPQAIYREAGIRDSEISDKIEMVFRTLKRLNYEIFPNPPTFHLELSRDQLLEVYQKDLKALGL